MRISKNLPTNPESFKENHPYYVREIKKKINKHISSIHKVKVNTYPILFLPTDAEFKMSIKSLEIEIAMN